MEVSNENEDLKENEQTGDDFVTETYEKIKSTLSVWMGLIITICGVAIMFFVSALEGTKEVKASHRDNASIISIWRENNESPFPEEGIDIVVYKTNEYYFIVDEYDDNFEIVKWHFAYDGGLDYVFGDYKFYVLTALVIVISIYVGYTNYVTRIRKSMESKAFKNTLKWYQKQKSAIMQNSEFLPDFCIYKTQQLYEEEKRNVVEEAGLNYEKYNKGEISLQKWQKKHLKKIKKIKVERISSRDLLQEHGSKSHGFFGLGKRKVSLLPMGETEHKRNFLIIGGVQRILTAGLSGLVVAFGVVLGNWYLGAMYGLAIIMSAISAIVIATDFVLSTLRNRYISKADLLIEFNNIKQKFIEGKAKEVL